MDLDLDIKELIEDWVKEYKPSDLKKIAADISYNYLNNQRKDDAFINSKEYAITYAIIRMPATFSASISAFESIFELYKFQIKDVLDLGAGLGSSSLALSKIINTNDLNFTLIERDINMIELGSEILTHKNLNFNYVNSDIKSYEITKKYDLIILSYSFNEFSKNDQEEIINKYLPYTDLLVIIDPGTPECHQSLMNIKNIVSKQYHIIAPCIYKNTCPLNNDWCHFITRLSRSSLHRYLKDADAPFEDEKFTYLAISKNVVEINKNRILRHPIIKGNSVCLSLCSINGVINKEIYKSDKIQYKTAKKAKAGNLI